MDPDPSAMNPDLYRVAMENDRVRAIEYRDRPGDRTATHGQPDSVMVTLAGLRRRLIDDSHAIFIEPREPGPATRRDGVLDREKG